MYSTTNELPPNVKAALTAEEQNVWMKSYNDTSSTAEAWKAVEPTARIFDFIANAEVIDTQGELVKYDALLRAMPQYIGTGGPVIDMHTNRVVGTVFAYAQAVTSEGHKAVKCKAAIFKGQQRYDAVWEDIKLGRKPAVSIGGDKLQQYMTCTADECHVEISKLHLYEISVVTAPANPEAVITAVNSTAKSKDFSPQGQEEVKKMTEEENKPPADASEEEMDKNEEETPGKNSIEDILAQVVSRQEATERGLADLTALIQSMKPPAPPAEEMKEDEKDPDDAAACKCNKKTDTHADVRKSLEKGSSPAGIAGVTPVPGIATSQKAMPMRKMGDLQKVSWKEMEATYRKGAF